MNQEKMILKRKMCVFDELVNDESETISADILFNLPSFMLQMVDRETRIRLFNSAFAIKDESNDQKRIQTEFRQIFIPQSYLETDEVVNSSSSVDKTPELINKGIQYEDNHPENNDDNQLYSRVSSADEMLSSTMNSLKTSDYIAQGPTINNDGKNLSRTFTVKNEFNKNECEDPISPNMWRKLELEQISNQKHENEEEETKIRLDVKRMKKKPVKKLEEMKPTKLEISFEESERRKKLVKMQKIRNSKYHINHNHINTNNKQQQQINNIKQQLSYNPEKAQEFMRKKKKEKMMKKKMKEEDMKMKDEKKSERLMDLRKKQLHLVAKKKYIEKLNGKNNEVPHELNKVKENDQLRAEEFSRSSSLHNIEKSVSDPNPLHKEFVLPPRSEYRPIMALPLNSNKDLSAKDILQKYAEQNKIQVEEIVAKFSQHVENIKNFVLKDIPEKVISNGEFKSNFEERLSNIKNMSNMLQYKICDASNLIISENTCRTSLPAIKLSTNDANKTRNSIQSVDMLMSPLDEWTATKNIATIDPLDVILKDLNEEDPLNVFNILAKKQREFQVELKKEVDLVDDTSVASDDEMKKNESYNDYMNVDTQTSLSYDDDFEVDDIDDIDTISSEKIAEMKVGNEHLLKDMNTTTSIISTIDVKSIKSHLNEERMDVGSMLGDVQIDISNHNSDVEINISVSPSDDLSIHHHPIASIKLQNTYKENELQSNVAQQHVPHMSPGDLELRLMAEVNFMEVLESSINQINDIERSKVISEVKQENITLNHILKSQEVIHAVDVDAVIRTLNDGISNQQMQQIQLHKLQQQQEQQIKLIKNMGQAVIENEHRDEQGHQQYLHKIQQVAQQPHQEPQIQQQTQYQQDQMNHQQPQHQQQSHFQQPQHQTHHQQQHAQNIENIQHQLRFEEILGNSLVNVVELQKEASVNLARVTSMMIENNLMNEKMIPLNVISASFDQEKYHVQKDEYNVSKRFVKHSNQTKKDGVSFVSNKWTPHKRQTTSNKMMQQQTTSRQSTSEHSRKSPESITSDSNLKDRRNSSEVSIATEIEEMTNESDENIEVEIHSRDDNDSNRLNTFSNEVSIQEEIQTASPSSFIRDNHGGNDDDDDDDDGGGGGGGGENSKTSNQFKDRKELNSNNNESIAVKLKKKDLNWDSFSTSMIQIQMKEEHSMHQHKFILLETKQRLLEENYKIELLKLKKKFNERRIDGEKMMKQKMKMNLIHKIRKTELKRMMEGVEASMDAQKMMMEEASHLHDWLNLNLHHSEDGSEISSPTISSDHEDAKEMIAKVEKDKNVSSILHKKDMLVEDCHHGISVDSDDDDDDDDDDESTDMKQLGTPVYEGSSINSENISEVIQENISSPHSSVCKDLSRLNASNVEREDIKEKFDIFRGRENKDESLVEETNYKKDGAKRFLKRQKKEITEHFEGNNNENILNAGKDENENDEVKDANKLNNGTDDHQRNTLFDATHKPSSDITSDVASESFDNVEGSAYNSDNKDKNGQSKESILSEKEVYSSTYSSSNSEETSIKTNPSSFHSSAINPLPNRKFSNPSLSSIILPPLDLDQLKAKGSLKLKKSAKKSSIASDQEEKEHHSNEFQQHSIKTSQPESARTLDEIDEEFSWSQEIDDDLSRSDAWLLKDGNALIDNHKEDALLNNGKENKLIEEQLNVDGNLTHQVIKIDSSERKAHVDNNTSINEDVLGSDDEGMKICESKLDHYGKKEEDNMNMQRQIEEDKNNLEEKNLFVNATCDEFDELVKEKSENMNDINDETTIGNFQIIDIETILKNNKEICDDEQDDKKQNDDYDDDDDDDEDDGSSLNSFGQTDEESSIDHLNSYGIINAPKSNKLFRPSALNYERNFDNDSVDDNGDDDANTDDDEEDDDEEDDDDEDDDDCGSDGEGSSHKNINNSGEDLSNKLQSEVRKETNRRTNEEVENDNTLSNDNNHQIDSDDDDSKYNHKIRKNDNILSTKEVFTDKSNIKQDVNDVDDDDDDDDDIISEEIIVESDNHNVDLEVEINEKIIKSDVNLDDYMKKPDYDCIESNANIASIEDAGKDINIDSTDETGDISATPLLEIIKNNFKKQDDARLCAETSDNDDDDNLSLKNEDAIDIFKGLQQDLFQEDGKMDEVSEEESLIDLINDLP